MPVNYYDQRFACVMGDGNVYTPQLVPDNWNLIQ